MSKSRETFQKRDKEKKRLQKRNEKEARREDRKAHSLSGKPLDEMIVYVDENGNLSETPPETVQQKSAAPFKEYKNDFTNNINRADNYQQRGV